MKILITGGNGFIGTNFLRYSIPRYPGYEFVNVDALTYAACPGGLDDVEANPRYAFSNVDIADSDALDQVFEIHRPELVVHFAAESHVDRSIEGPRTFVRTNVVGTLNLLEACRKHFAKGGGLFHHVSTDEVYGSLGPTGRFTERTAYDPSSPYSATKAASDHLVRAYHRTFGLPVKITNCSNNYGPWQFPEKLIPLMILNLLDRQPLPIYGDGGNVRDWLFVDDHCRAIWSVIERGRMGETYNVGGDQERTNLEVVDALSQTVAELTSTSRRELDALKVFVSDRPGHDRRYAIDARKVRSECGWAPRETFESGIRRTVQWYLDHPEWIERVRSGHYESWIRANYGERDSHAASKRDGVTAQRSTRENRVKAERRALTI